MKLQSIILTQNIIFMIAFSIILFTFCLILHRIVKNTALLKEFKGCFVLFSGLSFMRYLNEMKQKYGDCFKLVFLWKAYLVLCDPVAIKAVLLSDGKCFRKGADYTQSFSAVFGDGLVTSTGDKHKHDRALFAKYFSRANVSRYVPAMNEIALEAIHSMLLSAGDWAASNGDGVFDIENFASVVTLRVFLKFMGNYEMLSIRQELEACKMISEGSFIMGAHIVSGVPVWPFLPSVMRMRRYRAHLCEQILQPMVEKRKRDCARISKVGSSGLLPGNRFLLGGGGGGSDSEKLSRILFEDCLAAMLAAGLDPRDMEDHFITLLCTGHDTTSYLISYTVYMLATHTDVQDRLRQEIRARLGSREIVTSDDVGAMTYLQGVILEALRLYAVVPMVTRLCVQETQLPIIIAATVATSSTEQSKDSTAGSAAAEPDDNADDSARSLRSKQTPDQTAAPTTPVAVSITIPQGATVLLPLYLVNREPSLWEHPKDFIPERHTGCTGDTASTSAAASKVDSEADRAASGYGRSVFVPFGVGPRSCVGNTLAQLEAAVVVCHLVRKFRLLEAVTPDGVPVKPAIRAGISLTTANGVQIRLERI